MKEATIEDIIEAGMPKNIAEAYLPILQVV